MLRHMRTTVDIPDTLYRELREKAAKESVPMRQMIIGALKLFLKGGANNQKQQRFKLKDQSVDGKGINPDFDSWEKIRNEIYKGHGA